MLVMFLLIVFLNVDLQNDVFNEPTVINKLNCCVYTIVVFGGEKTNESTADLLVAFRVLKLAYN